MPFILGTLSSPKYEPERTPIEEPSHGVMLEFPEALSIWSKLLPLERTVLNMLAFILLNNYDTGGGLYDFLAEGFGPNNKPIPDLDTDRINVLVDPAKGLAEVLARLGQKGRNLVKTAIERLDEREEIANELSSLSAANSLIDELRAHLIRIILLSIMLLVIQNEA